MNRTIISTPDAPAAVGPYSQAVKTDSLVFVSGQIPLDPATGEVVGGGIRSQTRRSLQNVSAVLTAAGSSLADVVKATIFITNMDDFAAVNEVYAEFFGASLPARACVEVAALPRGVQVEIEAIAQWRD